MNAAEPHLRYQELQAYVGWTDTDARRVREAAALVRASAGALVDDFYAEIERHPRARMVITGGEAQVERLKQTLHRWIEELFAGPYDEQYVARRARVGRKHVEIGLAQVFTNVAFARLRAGIAAAVIANWRGRADERAATLASIHKLLDLDLAVITAEYEREHVRREQAAIRAQLADALHQEREVSSGLFAHAPAVVLVLDLRGYIVRFNAHVQALAGLTAEEAEGRDWLSLLVPEADRPRARHALFEQVLKQESSVGAATTGLVGSDHTRREVRWSSTLLRSASGEPFALLVLGQDITDLKLAQERALRSERLAAIGQIVTGMAHEARNALQRIQASAEMLELEVQRQPEALDYVRRIEQAQTHMHRLFEEVRGYAAPVQLDRAPCKVAAAWREAWDLLTPQRAGRQATLHELPQADTCEACADRFRLVQIFRNILENALAACDDPAAIHIECSRGELANGGDGRSRRALRISIRDNGPGLAPEQRKRIFEPFFTTKPKGTGLGMAIVQRLVEAHGGTIEVGTPASGAEIILTLPIESPQ